MFKTVKGLVLRRKRFGEAHAYITAITESGLVTFVAFGIMSPKSKSFASCQPYTLSEFVLTVKGDSFTLSQASTISHLIKQGIDFERLSLANYIASMACDTNFAEEDAPAIYSLTCTALSLADRSETPSEIIKAVFELRLTSALGFEPDFSGCILCGGELDGGTFLHSEGGVVCKSCIVPEGVQGVSVTKPLLTAMEHMLALPDVKAFGIRFSDPVALNVFCTLAERFSAEHLDCATTALTYYKQNLKNFI